MECRLENITVSYEQFGEGRPLLLLHGMPLDHRHVVNDFEPLFRERTGWKRIYPDMPGMGKTPGPDWVTNQDQILDILLAFIDAVIPEQRFSLAGASYGAYMAQGVIYSRPHMVDGVLFLVPMVHMEWEDRAVPSQVILVEDEALLSELEADNARKLRQLAVVQSRDLLEHFRKNLVPALDIADREFLGKLGERFLFSFDVNNLPQPFEKPALFLTGRQDSFVGYRDSWNVLENYPRASFVVLDRAGHALGVEQKGLFGALAEDWLDRVEESSAQAV